MYYQQLDSGASKLAMLLGRSPFVSVFIAGLLLYLILVRSLRYKRAARIQAQFGPGRRPLSSMTTGEAHAIMTELQELEFPSAFNKARSIALLKAGAIPTMSKLFAATGQNTRKTAGKRAVDTEILLREAQSMPRDSERYMQAVARMNFFHSRYRKAGKILDGDLLHTLGDNVVEALRIVETQEWRSLTDTEICAVGVFHKNLGDDLEIPFTPLPSSQSGWKDGRHFALELKEWTENYEKEAAVPSPASDKYVRVYVDSATSSLPWAFTLLLRKTLGYELDDTMRKSLSLEAPGPILKMLISTTNYIRIFVLRYLSLPRPTFLAVKSVDEDPNPASGLYNFRQFSLQPWYVKPTFWATWSPMAMVFRLFGGRRPGALGDRYRPQGYDLKTIGPQPQEGRGLEEMQTTIEFLKSHGAAKCPFSH